ncbi:hypothetical protein [Amycolatopsis echigonensis]|uniref:Uncharacterized protein n=1 Tax=Amycolatopsis echigonensis TaxID=2576905 RepID=A0A8E1VVV4_9PSEU|nr:MULTISPECIES: hypothetical protein [Amycolatopsis]MBB2499267.1 hypothetical protein [Amycolatopsis echigonensis]
MFEQGAGQRSGITYGVERAPPGHVNGQRQNGEPLVVGVLISLSDEVV